MSVEHFEILVEEPSAEAFLRGSLPKLIGETSFEIYSLDGKQKLLRCLTQRLRGYASFLPESWLVVVLVDRDSQDCLQLKSQLEESIEASGLTSRTVAADLQYQVLPRIVVQELESWFFGDWEAVRRAYPRVAESIPRKAKYRDPEAIDRTWEELEKVLQRAGYFEGGLRKIELAREIAKHFDYERCRAHSLGVFVEAIREQM